MSFFVLSVKAYHPDDMRTRKILLGASAIKNHIAAGKIAEQPISRCRPQKEVKQALGQPGSGNS